MAEAGICSQEGWRLGRTLLAGLVGLPAIEGVVHKEVVLIVWCGLAPAVGRGLVLAQVVDRDDVHAGGWVEGHNAHPMRLKKQRQPIKNTLNPMNSTLPWIALRAESAEL